MSPNSQEESSTAEALVSTGATTATAETSAPSTSRAAPSEPPVLADLPGVPVFTVEDLARQSDLVVVAARGQHAEDVRINVAPNAPESEFSIVELQIQEVLRSALAFRGDTVSVWLPQQIVPSGNLADRYVLFLRHPPDDFDATALEHLAKHPNPAIPLPGVTSIMDLDGSEVSVRGGIFYGLHAGDARPIAGPGGIKVEPEYVLQFSLDEVRDVAAGVADPSPPISSAVEPPEPSTEDQRWLEQLDTACEQSVPAALELRDFLNKAYEAGQIDSATALMLFDQAELNRASLDEGITGLSADLAGRWKEASKALVVRR